MIRIRPYAESDRAAVNAVARAAFFPMEWPVIRMLVVDPRRRG